ncbi:MAG TPA: LLM class flavin-dependent oxidoreductase [Candidatus Limnocylindrales bacterium]|nr:LLM class flavin-dependent oxidoreductase [Candidatus Limnocylindrales bacterium]
MRAAIRLPNTNRVVGLDALRRVCVAADELGYYAVSADDHIVFDGSYISCGSADSVAPGQDHDKLEVVTALSFAAAWTKDVRLLAGVMLVPVREPILMAKQAATLDFLSGGRLIVGAGLGGLVSLADADASVISRTRRDNRVREYKAFGVTGNRGSLLDEHIQAMVAIWTQQSATFHGQHVSFDDLDVFPKPLQKPRPPVWIGGRSAKARERAARLGDAWYPSQISAEQYGAGAREVISLRAAAGLDEPTDHPVNLFASLSTSDEAAIDRGVRTVGPQFTTRAEFDSRTIMGSPPTFIRRLREYQEAGVDLVEFKLLYDTVEELLETMKILATDVLPAVDEPLPRRTARA